MTSRRLRWAIWILLTLSVVLWWFRSFQIGDAIGGSFTSEIGVEINSWRGTSAAIFSWGGILVPWNYWNIPVTENWLELRESILRPGVHFHDLGGTSGISICWPLPLPLVIAFIAIEGTAFLRRRRTRLNDVGEDDARPRR